MLFIEKGTKAFDQGLSSYWSLYRNLEEQLLDMSVDIDFCEANFNVYSAKFLMLLETVCGEVESIVKTLVSLTKESAELDLMKRTFGDCWYYIQDKYYFHPQWIFKEDQDGKERLVGGKPLEKVQVYFLGAIPVRPFAHFRVISGIDQNGNRYYMPAKGCRLPAWWTSHNTLKHRRITVSDEGKIVSNFSQANLRNTIGAFAGLYVLIRCFLENVGEPDDLKSFVNTDRLFKGRELDLSRL